MAAQFWYIPEFAAPGFTEGASWWVTFDFESDWVVVFTAGFGQTENVWVFPKNWQVVCYG